jgi:hypothetical protein
VKAARRWSVLFVVLAGLAATGCPVGPRGPEGVPVATLYVVNNSSDEVAYLYVAPTGSADWGPDVLGAENTIEPGQTFSVQVVPGTYDLVVQNFDRVELGRQGAVRIVEDAQWILYDE